MISNLGEKILKIAIIGSFRQHIKDVEIVRDFFLKNDIIITTPCSLEIIEPKIPFVRFITDETYFSNEMIQSATIERIFSSNIVYVVAPDGYIGRTTCYEIGRVIQYNIPIYFSQFIQDLPIYIPYSHVLTKEEMLEVIKHNEIKALYVNENNRCAVIENKLINKVKNA